MGDGWEMGDGWRPARGWQGQGLAGAAVAIDGFRIGAASIWQGPGLLEKDDGPSNRKSQYLAPLTPPKKIGRTQHYCLLRVRLHLLTSFVLWS